jgi:hypothetical protein
MSGTPRTPNGSNWSIRPITEGYVKKGGLNPSTSQVVSRPAPPAPMRPTPAQPSPRQSAK